MNIYRAIVETIFPPTMQSIAGGDYRHCEGALLQWTENHPTSQYAHAYIVQVAAEIIYEPGVGVYAVEVVDGKETEATQ